MREVKKGAIPWNKGKKCKSLSDTHKLKLSNALRGENNPNYGKPQSEKTRLKNSESNKRLRGEEHFNYGRHRSEEQKEK